jgi:hypothetical protein
MRIRTDSVNSASHLARNGHHIWALIYAFEARVFSSTLPGRPSECTGHVQMERHSHMPLHTEANSNVLSAGLLAALLLPVSARRPRRAGLEEEPCCHTHFCPTREDDWLDRVLTR